MSSDDVTARQHKCREQCRIISSQFPELMTKIEAIEVPLKKKPRRSKKKNPEAAKSSALQRAESVRAACKDLANTIRGCLKELGEDVNDEGVPGPSGPPVEGN